MKFLYFGDPHIRGTNPRNRTDDYKEALKSKLLEIFKIAEYNKVDAIFQPGDTFDRPEVSISVLLEFAEIFKQSPVPIYTTAGNHDLYSYNLDTLGRTSLKLLELIVPQFNLIIDPAYNLNFTDGQNTNNVAISFQPYDDQIDRNGFGYSPQNPEKDAYKIHIAHGMLLDHDPPFDRYSKVQDVETEADLVITGHDHIGFDKYVRRDGKVFINPGAICRLSASKGEIARTVNVLLIEVDKQKLERLELIELRSAKPGEEVLDRSQIEAEQKRQYAMEEFASLIQDRETGTAVAVDINAIVEEIAEKQEINPDVVELALKKIGDAREEMK